MRAKFRKWRLSTLQVALLLGSLAFLTLGGVAATVLYFTTHVDRQQLEQLRVENHELKRINGQFEASITELESQLGGQQERFQKLAIVAGLSELAPDGEAGIGGSEPTLSELMPGDELGASLLSLELQMERMNEGMGQLENKLDERRSLISSTPAITPIKGLLTSGFGFRTDPFSGRRAFHRGIDIIAPLGRELRATGDGIVTKAGRDSGLGKAVFISHGFGISTRYGHMSKILVKEGQEVKRGEAIGVIGSTGRSTGTHAHYEVWVDGKPTDPLGYILDGTDEE